MNKKITTVYFSPTENTKKSVAAMAEAIGTEVDTVDVTIKRTCSSDKIFTEKDFVIFGAPVYGGRIPAIARDRLEKFSGQQTPCIVVATFGNRHFDDALLEMKNLAENQGFVVKGAAALVGRHTFGEIQMDRPNAEDFAQMKDFAIKAASREENLSEVPGNFPFKQFNSPGFYPKTSEACIKCGKCVGNCPVEAIGEDCSTTSDKCISCFRCIRNCPTGARNMNEENYQNFAVGFTQRLKDRKENFFF